MRDTDQGRKDKERGRAQGAARTPSDINLTLVPVPWLGPVRKRIAQIYAEAFAPSEQAPLWRLSWNAAIGRGEFLAAVTDAPARGAVGADDVVGLAYVHHGPCGDYLLFLAVAQQQRGAGVGSALMAALQERSGALTLAIEAVDERFADYEMRAARARFYARAGFVDSGWRVREICGVYELHAWQMQPNIEEYRRAIHTQTVIPNPVAGVYLRGRDQGSGRR